MYVATGAAWWSQSWQGACFSGLLVWWRYAANELRSSTCSWANQQEKTYVRQCCVVVPQIREAGRRGRDCAAGGRICAGVFGKDLWNYGFGVELIVE